MSSAVAIDTLRGAHRSSGVETAVARKVIVSDPAPNDDALLVERVRSGDRDALGLLYDRYAPHAMAIGLRMLHDREAAEDLVHDTFVAVWQKIGRFDASRGSIRTWILSITRNRAIDRIRATRPTETTDDVDAAGELATDATATWDHVEERLSSGDLRNALERLPHE